ncbi:hypothetical protein F5880DRAFT_1511458 [Lentinula raphanica]|nr:hypothetical protein F5880DRAFT_1511458 [Lentinula raphanica]
MTAAGSSAAGFFMTSSMKFGFPYIPFNSFHHPSYSTSPHHSSRLVLGLLLQIYDAARHGLYTTHTTLEICQISESSPTNTTRHDALNDSSTSFGWFNGICGSDISVSVQITLVDNAASSSSYFLINQFSQGLVVRLSLGLYSHAVVSVSIYDLNSFYKSECVIKLAAQIRHGVAAARWLPVKLRTIKRRASEMTLNYLTKVALQQKRWIAKLSQTNQPMTDLCGIRTSLTGPLNEKGCKLSLEKSLNDFKSYVALVVWQTRPIDPPFNLEKCFALSIYIAARHRMLGRIFFVASTGNRPGTIRILWDDVVLPREILESDLELNQMLQQCWNISRENRRSRSIPVSTPTADTRRRIAHLTGNAVQAISASSPSSAVPPVVLPASATHSRYPRPVESAGQAAHRPSPSLSDSSAVLPPSPTASVARRRVSEWAHSTAQVLPAAVLSALPTASPARASSDFGHSVGATRASSTLSNNEPQSGPGYRNRAESDNEYEFIDSLSANRMLHQESEDEVQFIGSRPANRIARQESDNEIEYVDFPPANGTARQESDNEIEYLGFRPANVIARQESDNEIEYLGFRPANRNIATTSSQDFSIIVTIVAWKEDSHEHTSVKLALQNGQFIMLSMMVPEALRTLQLSNVPSLDRYIPEKGWKHILMNTLFKVSDGDVVSLKPSTVQHIKNFKVHASHLY